MKIAMCTSDKHIEMNRASLLGTIRFLLHSSCLYSIFIIYQNFVFLITRLIEVSVEYKEERKSLKTNSQVLHFYQPHCLIDNQCISIQFKTNYCDLAVPKKTLLFSSLRYDR